MEQIATDANGVVLVHIAANTTAGETFGSVKIIDRATNSVTATIVLPNDPDRSGIAAIP